jgi:hypothetical protein
MAQTKVFRVSAELHKKVAEEAKRKKRNIGVHLEDILERYFRRNGKAAAK